MYMHTRVVRSNLTNKIKKKNCAREGNSYIERHREKDKDRERETKGCLWFGWITKSFGDTNDGKIYGVATADGRR